MEYSGISQSVEEITAIIFDKFNSEERVRVVLTDVLLDDPDWVQRERIFAIVQGRRNTSENVLFVLLPSCHPSSSALDLTIERILPIDKCFSCDIGDECISTDLILHVMASRHPRLSYTLKRGSKTDAFVNMMFHLIESAARADNLQFDWVSKYSDTIVLCENSGLISSGEVETGEDLLQANLQSTIERSFNIFVGTWNVNGKRPPFSLKQWLSTGLEPPDIYAVGFQELDLSKEAFIFNYTQKEVEWLLAVEVSLDSRAQYVKVHLIRLVGMMLIVFARKECAKYIRNVDYCTVGTGLMGKLGNKGGVSIRFDFSDTSVCFVNSHLATHLEEIERRNQDYHEICSRTQFNQSIPAKRINDHEQIYWLGDLNYRITNMDHQTVKIMLKDSQNIPFLLHRDQLKLMCDAKVVFVGFKEGSIDFQPTYKYDIGTNEWDSSEKKRTPAWCDRIFWKGEPIEQLKYTSHPELNTSDHKPVSAIFRSEMKIFDTEKHQEFLKKLDMLENEFLPDATVTPTELFFDDVKYLEKNVRTVYISNLGKIPVEFEFINKADDTSYCKDWLKIRPNKERIDPKDTCDIQFEILVDKRSAYKLNSGEDRLDEIVVLHLKGGKDIFITVTGTYTKSCFGSSIDTLIHLRAPIHEQSLNEDNDMCYRSDPYPIPKELWFLVDHIYKHGLRQPNLFSNPATYLELLQIRDWLDNGSCTEMPGAIYSVVKALLMFLESTAEPIIPYKYHNACLKVSDNYTECKKIIAYFPIYANNVFLYLCSFLREVLNYSLDNNTDPMSLAMLFGSIFLRNMPHAQSNDEHQEKKTMFIYQFLLNDD